MTDALPYELRIPVENAFDATIGFVVDEADEIGRCAGHLPVRPGVCQPMGIIHGGVYAAIAETLASMGTWFGVRDDGMVALGLSNNTSFLRPITDGTISAIATRKHRGRTTWVWEVECSDDEGRLCTLTRVTMAVRDAPAEPPQPGAPRPSQ